MLMPILESNEKKRRAAILRVASRDIELGFLFAVFNFEWSLRRMILKFSKCPTIVIRARLVRGHGFKNYCEFWDECVCKFNRRLISMIEILGLNEANFIEQYYERRHVLVHGAHGGVGFVTAICGISRLLNASETLVEFARKQGENLFGRLNPRQNVRCGFTLCRGTEPFKNGQTDGPCPAQLMVGCPMLSNNEARKAIFKNLRKSLQPVEELAGVKGEALVEKVRKVAEELGIAEKSSIKKAICNLEQKCVEHKK